MRDGSGGRGGCSWGTPSGTDRERGTCGAGQPPVFLQEEIVNW